MAESKSSTAELEQESKKSVVAEPEAAGPSEAPACKQFVPNIKGNASRCATCGNHITTHARTVVNVPSLVLEESAGLESVFIGGYQAVTNSDWLQKQRIRHVICAAGNFLDKFGDKYAKAVNTAKSQGITFLQLDWQDWDTWNISKDLRSVVEFIHKARSAGAVLVHCEQGKSRSVSCVVAYVMASKRINMSSALSFVQTKRYIAAPNAGFQKQLLQFEEISSSVLTESPPASES